MKYLLLVLLVLVSCTKIEEDHYLRQEGEIAHYDVLDFPIVILVSETIDLDVYGSALKACAVVNDAVGGSACLLQKVSQVDARLNGFIEPGVHVLRTEDIEGAQQHGKTEVVYYHKKHGYGPARIFSTDTIVDDDLPSYDKVLFHEVGHILGLADLHQDKSSVMYISAMESSGDLVASDRKWLREQFLGTGRP